MPASASELRQSASSLLPFTLSHAETSPACKVLVSKDQEPQSANNKSAAGRGTRKVLADLAGNDSPIVGLIPGLPNCATSNLSWVPGSCDFKSVLGTKTKKLVIPTSTEGTGNTPVGESLLRSQVQLLLQKVESDAPTIHKPAPSLRALCHLHAFMDSPALKLVAPTPINTPCASISACVQPSPTGTMLADLHLVSKFHESDQVLLDQTNHRKEEDRDRKEEVQKMHESGIKLLVDLHISSEVEASAPMQRLSHPAKSSENGHITITDSVLSGRDHHIMQATPLISQAFDEAEFPALGKKTTRTLQFDSPDKVSSTEQMETKDGICTSVQFDSPDKVSPTETKDGICTSVRELEEDELSEWSILVNVSSPDQTGTRDFEAELYEEDYAESRNLQLNPKTPMWTSFRRGTPFPKGTLSGDDDDDEDDRQNDGIEALEDDGVHCKESSRSEVACGKGLPRAEGKHIRFSYESDDDEI